MEENLTKSKTYIYCGKKTRISLLIRPLIIADDNLLSCLSALISVAASHFPWIGDVIRAVRLALYCRSE